MKDVIDSISKMLYKKALGYKVKENIDEFVIDEGESKPRLVKRKVTTKHVAPDISAAKALLAMRCSDNEVSDMTDEQLEEEKSRLLKLLSRDSDGNTGVGNGNNEGEI